MRQRTIVSVVVAVAALTVLASVATAAATGLAGGTGANAPVPAATSGAAADSVSPGQRLTGVIGAQRAEVEGEIESRSFDVRVSSASSTRSKASVVAEEVTDLEGRLETLQNRRAELARVHENGNVSDGVYRARVTELAARIETTKRLVDATDSVANDLPENDLEAAGVRRANITQLRQRATNLSERGTASVARSVVGGDVGEGMGPPADPNESTARGNGTTGGPGSAANATETGAPGRSNDRSDEHPLGVDASANATGNGTNASVNTNAGTGTADDGANATVGVGVDVGGDAETAVDETGTPTNEPTTTDETEGNGFLTDWTEDETESTTDQTTTTSTDDTTTTTSTDDTTTTTSTDDTTTTTSTDDATTTSTDQTTTTSTDDATTTVSETQTAA